MVEIEADAKVPPDGSTDPAPDHTESCDKGPPIAHALPSNNMPGDCPNVDCIVEDDIGPTVPAVR